MSYASWPEPASEPRTTRHLMRIEGTGAADPTKDYGRGITATRVAAGKYRFTFAEKPGTFVSALATFLAADPAAMKGHTYAFDTWDSTNLRLDVWVHDATDTLDDLEDDEWLCVEAVFSLD